MSTGAGKISKTDHAAPGSYPQRYLLQTRNARGHIVTLGSYSFPITEEEALKEWGPGRDYTLKRVSPRFQVEWKIKNSTTEIQSNSDSVTQQKLGILERRTKLNTVGIIGLGLVTGIGFGLSHLRFNSSEDRLAALEAVVETLSASRFICPNCSLALQYMLQKYCSSCGVLLSWPKGHFPIQQPSEVAQCSKCNRPLLDGQLFCPNCGQPRPDQPQSLQVSGWSLQ